MILTEQEIKNILNKTPKLMKSKLGNFTINQFEYDQKELLDLIQTYIKEKKSIDVGEIKVTGHTCASFIQFLIVNGLDMFKATTMASDLEAMNYASYICIKYYNNKFKEQ